MHMLHHVSLGVTNIERSAELHDAMLGPRGYVRVWSYLRPGSPTEPSDSRLALRTSTKARSPAGTWRLPG